MPWSDEKLQKWMEKNLTVMIHRLLSQVSKLTSPLICSVKMITIFFISNKLSETTNQLQASNTDNRLLWQKALSQRCSAFQLMYLRSVSIISTTLKKILKSSNIFQITSGSTTLQTEWKWNSYAKQQKRVACHGQQLLRKETPTISYFQSPEGPAILCSKRPKTNSKAWNMKKTLLFKKDTQKSKRCRILT